MQRTLIRMVLLFGVYSDAGYYTCAGRPGSLGYETIDADTCENKAQTTILIT